VSFDVSKTPPPAGVHERDAVYSPVHRKASASACSRPTRRWRSAPGTSIGDALIRLTTLPFTAHDYPYGERVTAGSGNGALTFLLEMR
jgi:hypothetical protein